MRICEECALENPDTRDFCSECGWYLRWELTGELPPMTPEGPGAADGRAGARTAVQPARMEQVTVTLRVPGTEIGPTEAAEVAVMAGGDVVLLATVHNHHDTVKRFEVRVEGLPDETWWSVTPGVAHLLPPGGAGGYEAEVEIRLHPPRSAEAEARRWPFWVEAAPVDGGGAKGRSPMAGLTIDPFDHCVMSLEPKRRATRRAARFALTLRNEGNAGAVVVPDVRDDAGECRSRCEPARVRIPPGDEAAVAVTIRPPRPLVIGKPIDRAIHVDGRIDDTRPLPPLAGLYRQRAWLPRWLLLLIPLLLALAVLAWMRAPDTTVPRLSGLPGRFEAQRELEAAGLRLAAARETRVTTKTEPGTVVDQLPAAGEEAGEGDEVTVVVAVAAEKAPVPDVVGKTIREADKELGDRFALGAVTPADASLNATITSQRPSAGSEQQLGTPVDVRVEKSGQNGKPPVTSPPPTAPSPSPAPPATGRFAWAGPGGLVVTDGYGESTLPGTGGAMQPAWTADGAMIAFVREQGGRGRIWSVRPGDASRAPVALSDAEGDYRRPEYSPDGSALAFVDADTGSLCISLASGAADATSCLRDPTWQFTDVAWGTTGQALALAATPREPGDPAGVVEYIADGDPAIASSWRPAPSHRGLALELESVAQVAWSPSRERLAVLDGAPGRVHVVPTSGSAISTSGKTVPAVTACSVAWSLDEWLAVAESCDRGNAALALVDPASGEPSRLGAGSDPAPAPRPSGAESGAKAA